METNTPVESIGVSADGPPGYPYAIKTPRGITYVHNVVHATNGFASHLVPGLLCKIVGAKAHMSAQRPGQEMPRSDGNRSWGVVYGDGAFDYVTQRPSMSSESPGDILLGGGFMRSSKQGVDQIGLYDDNARLDALTVSHVMGIFPAIFHPKWGTGAEVKDVWTGILGMTGDLLPFVGRLDEKLTGRTIPKGQGKEGCGEWIAAGFVGEGMVWAWLCGVCVGLMIAGSEEEDLPQVPGMPGGKLMDWFPEEVLVSRKRIQSADISNLANTV